MPAVLNYDDHEHLANHLEFSEKYERHDDARSLMRTAAKAIRMLGDELDRMKVRDARAFDRVESWLADGATWASDLDGFDHAGVADAVLTKVRREMEESE